MASRNDTDLSWYEKNRANENIIKTAEFRSAKKIEEEALMTALGLKIMPPPTSTSQSKSVIKREPQSTSVKNEPMTPAVHHHNDSRKSKTDKHRRDDRRRKRQLKSTASDEEKNDWSENDEEDLMDEDYDNDETKHSIQQNMSTEKELDEFLHDLINKHGLKTIKHALKSKKEKKDRKRDQSSASSSSSESEDEKQRSHKKHKHKSKHSHREDSRSSKRHRTRSSPSPSRDRSKRRHDQ